MPLRLDEVSWIHGSADCAASTDPPLQVVSVDDDTHVLRQSKCFSFEAPFMYLLMGSEKAVLFDTGASPDDGDPRKILPIREAVDTLLSRRAEEGRAISELIIAHTHGHGDHVFWDRQFAGRPQTRIIGRGVGAVQHAFNLPAWPDGQATLDLGSRALVVLPLPGHVSDHIAVYDPRMQALLTGDTLYHGLLTVADWAAYRRSAARLAVFASEHPVSLVLGNHIEMTRTHGELYPLGTTFQPNEHPLPLSAEIFAEWHQACETIGNLAQRITRDHFIIERAAKVEGTSHGSHAQLQAWLVQKRREGALTIKPRARRPGKSAAEAPSSSGRAAPKYDSVGSSPYEQPTIRRPRRARMAAAASAAAGIGSAANVGVRGVEIVQVIQALDNRVRLIAGKPTIVRVYLDPATVAASTLVTGEITWRRANGGAFYLAAMNRVKLDPARTPDLMGQRFDVAESLNFVLPADALGAGSIELRLDHLNVPGGEKLPLAAQPAMTANFVTAPVLRIRAIGLRYRSTNAPTATITPGAIHFDYLRSYLTRAYPVAALAWSQIVIDGDRLRPPFGGNQSILVNAQLSALRTREISSGMDPRTHYYGLVDNEAGNSFMRGSALYDEATTIFGAVACGPCGVPNGWSGDSDASFADWYGAHELGHTFQRRHPGFPTFDPVQGTGQPRDNLETTFPYAGGLISSPAQEFVGFDFGDPALGLQMRALPGNIHHDVMTYADSQWLSAYTYEAIHDHLVHEDMALAPPNA